MTRDSVAAAREDLYVELTSLPGLAADQVYDHERTTYPVPAAVSVWYAGGSATEWRFEVRLHLAVGGDQRTAQHRLDDLAQTIGDHLRANSGWVLTTHLVRVLDDFSEFIAVWQVECGREDYML